jgi:starch phosphorylase
MPARLDSRHDGSRDLARAIERLGRRLPEPLQPLAEIAYNYRWSWAPWGRDLFRSLDPHRFELAGENPIRFLRDLPTQTTLQAATDPATVAAVEAAAEALAEELAREPVPWDGAGRPVAFLCAEFGVHASLPVYSGGLGVLAGDILKEASDDRYQFVGVGLLYRRGYFHQRVDLTGWQHEYWIEADPETLPMVQVTGPDRAPLTITVPVWGDQMDVHVWRVDVGRVPLYLLDAELPENTPVERWVTARLYEGTRAIRLAQYAVLGLGAVRALDAMGIDPALYHLNEGHPALAMLEVAARTNGSAPLADALASVRDRFVFTTHTPVPAGNETYGPDELLAVLGGVPIGLGFDPEELLRAGRVHPDDGSEPAGLTPLAIRAARATNAVSRRHGEVAREMWRPLFPGSEAANVPIAHVTNGVHLPTWMAPQMQALLDRYLEEGWQRHAADPAAWAGVDDIPDEELWGVRRDLRTRLVEMLRRKVVSDRLSRGEQIDFVLSATELFDADTLTVGFARRLAAYKRLNLLVHDPDRALALFGTGQPMQLVFAGKAHPLDEGAKAIARKLFTLKREPSLVGRTAFLEDYDLRVAATLTAGCDVWLNLPRPPLEASGTSGMKAALNGSLALSVLDGWWAEAYDGANGWSIDGSVLPDEAAQDARDAEALYDLLEHEVRPLFYERDERGIPRGWIALMKTSLKTLAPRFNATRMLTDYVENVYRR